MLLYIQCTCKPIINAFKFPFDNQLCYMHNADMLSGLAEAPSNNFLKTTRYMHTHADLMVVTFLCYKNMHAFKLPSDRQAAM